MIKTSSQEITKSMLVQQCFSLYELRKNKFFVEYIMPIFDFPVFTSIYGINWKVQIKLIRNLSWLIKSRSLAPEVGSLFLAINQVLNPKNFWDIGGNIGFYSWLLASHNSDIDITIFEPDPINIQLINKTISRAKLDKIKLIDAAVSDSSGEQYFSTDNITGATGTLELAQKTFIQRHYHAKQPKLIKVKTVTIDSLWQKREIHPPDLIKIDVEGAEKKVFDGGIEFIKFNQPCLIFETYFPEKEEIFQKLISLGYTLFNVEDIDGSLENALNILALPERYIYLTNNLLAIWKKELQVWRNIKE